MGFSGCSAACNGGICIAGNGRMGLDAGMLFPADNGVRVSGLRDDAGGL